MSNPRIIWSVRGGENLFFSFLILDLDSQMMTRTKKSSQRIPDTSVDEDQ